MPLHSTHAIWMVLNIIVFFLLLLLYHSSSLSNCKNLIFLCFKKYSVLLCLVYVCLCLSEWLDGWMNEIVLNHTEVIQSQNEWFVGELAIKKKKKKKRISNFVNPTATHVFLLPNGDQTIILIFLLLFSVSAFINFQITRFCLMQISYETKHRSCEELKTCLTTMNDMNIFSERIYGIRVGSRSESERSIQKSCILRKIICFGSRPLIHRFFFFSHLPIKS